MDSPDPDASAPDSPDDESDDDESDDDESDDDESDDDEGPDNDGSVAAELDEGASAEAACGAAPIGVTASAAPESEDANGVGAAGAVGTVPAGITARSNWSTSTVGSSPAVSPPPSPARTSNSVIRVVPPVTSTRNVVVARVRSSGEIVIV
ncbi:hypothetical protein [Plantactinospora sp. BB1]|uniref:hypothetical protein n=1 Tax=Plantactinospora sp. BB1 TaxID=2071627 RepID=UPI00131F10EA|nr:hypothetical protein [Plantactinospora sp. BB1]